MIWFNVCDQIVNATVYTASAVGACSLPENDYNDVYPVALGDISSLGELQFNPDLCGHILELDCGNGTINIIVADKNPGGSLDLHLTAWNKATNSRSLGIVQCTIRLTDLNPFKTEGNLRRTYRAWNSKELKICLKFLSRISLLS